VVVNVVSEAPSHEVRYCENPPSACLMRILYLVRGDPLLNGAVQIICSLLPITLVVGGSGLKGTQAHSELKTAESKLVPNTFVEVTTK
jgi:hypothetical protein